MAKRTPKPAPKRTPRIPKVGETWYSVMFEYRKNAKRIRIAEHTIIAVSGPQIAYTTSPVEDGIGNIGTTYQGCIQSDCFRPTKLAAMKAALRYEWRSYNENRKDMIMACDRANKLRDLITAAKK